MTYSIVARDDSLGVLGVAVQSHYFAVGAQISWAMAGVGVVATQSVVHPGYGSEGLARMSLGSSADDALQALLAEDHESALRQVAMLGVHGAPAVHTGGGCIGRAGHRRDAHVSAQGNMLASDRVCNAMVDAFLEADADDFGGRLIAALAAGEAAGGDLRGRQSAALRIVPTVAGAAADIDLRVDDEFDPIGVLARLWVRQRAAGLLGAVFGSGLLFRSLVEPEVAQPYLHGLERALALAPENREPQFWWCVLALKAGHDVAARVRFADLPEQQRWRALLAEIAAAGLISSDDHRMLRSGP